MLIGKVNKNRNYVKVTENTSIIIKTAICVSVYVLFSEETAARTAIWLRRKVTVCISKTVLDFFD